MSGDFDDVDKLLGPEPSKFRLQNKRIFMVYRTHLEFEPYLDWLNELLKKKKVAKMPEVQYYSIVHEVGKKDKDEGYPHTHVLLQLTEMLSTTNCRYFDYEDIHPHIWPVKSPTHWDNCVKYCTKQGIPYTNIKNAILSRIDGASTLREALEENVTSMKEVVGVSLLFDQRKLHPKPIPDVKWRPWQQDLFEEITNTKPNDRTIIWYNDKEGGGGKTLFSKHMFDYYNAVATNVASTYHIATLLQSFIQQHGEDSIKCVILNLTRASPQTKDMYVLIEAVKDGFITAQKYRTQQLSFKSPHVVIFANAEPQKQHLSKDRWDIRWLSDDGLYVSRREVAGKEVPIERPSVEVKEEPKPEEPKPEEPEAEVPPVRARARVRTTTQKVEPQKVEPSIRRAPSDDTFLNDEMEFLPKRTPRRIGRPVRSYA